MQIFDYFLSSHNSHKSNIEKLSKKKPKINEDELPRKSDATSHFYEDKESWQRKFSQDKNHTLKQKNRQHSDLLQFQLDHFSNANLLIDEQKL